MMSICKYVSRKFLCHFLLVACLPNLLAADSCTIFYNCFRIYSHILSRLLYYFFFSVAVRCLKYCGRTYEAYAERGTARASPSRTVQRLSLSPLAEWLKGPDLIKAFARGESAFPRCPATFRTFTPLRLLSRHPFCDGTKQQKAPSLRSLGPTG